MDIVRQVGTRLKRFYLSWRLGATTVMLLCWISFFGFWLTGDSITVGSSGWTILWRIMIGLGVLTAVFTGSQILLGSNTELARAIFLASSLTAWGFSALLRPTLANPLLFFSLISLLSYGLQYPKRFFLPVGFYLVLILIPIAQLWGYLSAFFLATPLIIFLIAAQRLLLTREAIINELDTQAVTSRVALKHAQESLKEHQDQAQINHQHIENLKSRYNSLKNHLVGASNVGQLFMRQADLNATANAWLKESLAYFPASGGGIYYRQQNHQKLMNIAWENRSGADKGYATLVELPVEQLEQALLVPQSWEHGGKRHIVLGYRDVEDYAFYIYLYQSAIAVEWTRDDIAWLRLISTAASGSMSSHLVRAQRDILAQQDQVMNQVTSELHRRLDLRSVLGTTAQQLGQALNTPKVRIRILPKDGGGTE